jgi:hypothetical protein
MWHACMLREIQPWLVVGLTYISFIDKYTPRHYTGAHSVPLGRRYAFGTLSTS